MENYLTGHLSLFKLWKTLELFPRLHHSYHLLPRWPLSLSWQHCAFMRSIFWRAIDLLEDLLKAHFRRIPTDFHQQAPQWTRQTKGMYWGVLAPHTSNTSSSTSAPACTHEIVTVTLLGVHSTRFEFLHLPQSQANHTVNCTHVYMVLFLSVFLVFKGGRYIRVIY